MAALCMCDEFLLFTNGRSAAFVSLRFPSDIQLLDVPIFEVKDVSDGAGQKPPCHIKQAVSASTQNKDEISYGGPDSQIGSAPASRITTQDENLILACTVCQDGRYLALCDDRKFLHVYKVADGRCTRQFSRPIARRCTTVRFTMDCQQVLVADKSGDVYSFHVPAPSEGSNSGEQHTGQAPCHATSLTAEGCTVDQPGGRADQGSTGVDSEGTLVLGHLSMLLDLLLMDNDRLVVTCDRDEKIRLSRYPDAYNIQAYCLGHRQFVISLAYDDVKKVIMSGSGDCTVRLWNLEGEELHCRQIWQDLPEELRASKTQSCGESWQTPANSRGDDSGDTRQQFIQQNVYSSACQLMFVSLYRCPHVLVYKLIDSENGRPSLQFVSILEGQHDIVSLCVNRSVLWKVSQRSSDLEVSAHRIHPQPDGVDFPPVVAGASSPNPESQILHTLVCRSDLLSAPPRSLDLIPLLWKSPHQEGFPATLDRKRQKTDVGQKEREKRQRH